MPLTSPCRRWLAAGVAVLVLALHAAPAAAQPKKIVTVEGITEYHLDNGFRYLLYPDPAANNVTVNLTVLVGSRHEGYGEAGMAHLLEHMLFKGSKKFPDPFKLLQGRGADFNGTTSFDRTNYYETMPGTDDNLKFALELEADRLVNSLVKREDLVLEMPVVRNEFEISENSPVAVLRNRLYAAAFEWHNYGKVTIGNKADIERVPIDRLQAFYKKYYQVDNCVLVVAGKFDEKKAIEYIGDTFGKLQKPKRVLDKPYTEEPTQDGERNVMLRRVGNGAAVGFMYHMPATAHPDFAPLDVLESVLLDNPSGRLYKRLVEGKKCTSVGGGTQLSHDPSVFMIFALVKEGVTPEEVRDIIAEEMENIKKKPVTAEELDRARKQMVSQYERKMTNTKSLGIELSEWIASGDWRLLFLHRERFKKATLDDLNRVGEHYFKQSNRTVGIFVPTKDVARAVVPETPNVAELVKDIKTTSTVAKGETFETTPENIEKRVKRLDLSGGLKVALLPKKTSGETVSASLTLRFGNEKALKDNLTAAEFLGPLMRRGTKKHTYQELQDELDKLSATLSVNSNAGSLTVSLKTKREHLPKVLALLEEVLREPTFPQAEFDILKTASKEGLERVQSEPQALGVRALLRKLNPYPKDDIRYEPTLPEMIERINKVTRDQVVKVYESQLGSGVGELVFIGDFDPDATVKQVEKFLGNWKAKVAFERIPKKAFTKVPGSSEEILTPDKKNGYYFSAFALGMKDTDPDALALEVGNYILGGGTASRLFDRLRVKGSLSYGAGSMLRLSPQDDYGMFVMQASAKPENIATADKYALEELNKLIKEGISGSDLELAKKGLLEDWRVDRGSDGALLGQLSTGLYLNRTMKFYADREKKVQELSIDDVNRAIRAHLDPARLITIRAGDFTKKENPKK